MPFPADYRNQKAKGLDPDRKRVIVVGFAPFPPYTINPASMVLELLPRLIKKTEESPQIELLIQEPVSVTYEATQSLPSKLFDHQAEGGALPDFVINVGMAGGDEHFSVEQQAHRDGYFRPDADGIFLKGGQWDAWVDENSPPVLTTKVGVQKVVDEMNEKLNASTGKESAFDVRKSMDAGRYLCEFVFYSDMRYWWAKGEDANVPGMVFFHIPGESDNKSLSRAAKAIQALVSALVKCGSMDAT